MQLSLLSSISERKWNVSVYKAIAILLGILLQLDVKALGEVIKKQKSKCRPAIWDTKQCASICDSKDKMVKRKFTFPNLKLEAEEGNIYKILEQLLLRLFFPTS